MNTNVKSRRIGSRLFSALLTLLMMVTIMFTGGIVTCAANITDTDWSFNITTTNNSYSLSDIRPKDDDSSFYVQFISTNGPTSFYLQTYGGLENNKSSMEPHNYGGIKFIPKTGRYSVRNMVYEDLHDYGENIYACFGVKASSISGYIGGVWSPDSVGSYTVLSVPALEY